MKKYCDSIRNCFYNDPSKFIKYVVLFVCCIIVIIQLSECYSKLRYPPIATYSHFDLNDTILLPAVTLCREPPYKHEVLEKYNLETHPKFQNRWKHFNFSNGNVEKMFEESTFRANETFNLCAIGGNEESINIESSLHFNRGKCYTLRPLNASKYVSKDYGYSINLSHHVDPDEDDYDIGWHVYVHESRENFTEFRMKASGKLEYIYLEVGEELEVKLQTQNFATLNDKIDNTVCADDPEYSELKCTELEIWKDISTENYCSGPWMKDINQKNCNDSKSMIQLINSYRRKYEENVEPNIKCKQPCKSNIYSTFVQNRKKIHQPVPMSQIYIYFSSKLVTIYEERPGYDLSQFVADMGGSLGFLLGLSVLGVIGILEHTMVLLFGSFIRKKQLKLQSENKTEENKSELAPNPEDQNQR